MVGERLKQKFDREPFWRKAEDKLSNPGHNIRNRIDDRMSNTIPRFNKRNFGGGIGAGAVGAAVGTALEDVVGVPFGGSTDTIDVRPATDGRGTVYVVNVNSPFASMAKVRAFIDAGTGFTSIITDQLNVEDVQVIGTRTLRDTYQIRLKVFD